MTGIAAKAAVADRKLRRVIVMSWFPGACDEREQPRTLPHLMLHSNHHGESIMLELTEP
jgi:hypothetical protein